MSPSLSQKKACQCTLWLLLLCVVQLPCCICWGEDGHRMIADAAYELLSDKAKEGVDSLLPTGYTLADVSTYADEYANSPNGKWSAKLHFANLPLNVSEFVLHPACNDGCVVTAIANYTEQLRSNHSYIPADVKQSSLLGGYYVSEPTPLEFVVHFVADVHQPLHVSWEIDAGGTEIKVVYNGESTELHFIWDVSMLDQWCNNNWRNGSALLQAEIKQNPYLVAQYEAITDPSIWANESFWLSQTTVYNFQPSTGLKPHEITLMRNRRSDDGYVLPAAYYVRNIPVIQHRLIAAVVRLATLLNSIFE